MQESLDKLYNFKTNSDEIDSDPQIKVGTYGRGQLVILDRTFDKAAPMMHDYSYWSLVQELLGGDPSHSIKEFDASQQIFNKNDDVWQQFKTVNVSEAQQDLERLISEMH